MGETVPRHGLAQTTIGSTTVAYPENLRELVKAQQQHALAVLQHYASLDFEYSDDGHDELRAAMKLAARLMEIDANADLSDWSDLWREEIVDYWLGACPKVMDAFRGSEALHGTGLDD